MPFYMGLVSVSLNLLGSPLFYIGLSMIAGSVFQMMNGSVVAFTAVLSVIFLKKKYYRQHWTGVLAIVGGVALVGWGGMRAKNKSAADTSLLGILITLAA
jgi:drug/metabolite transporter (DMT)-like permease